MVNYALSLTPPEKAQPAPAWSIERWFNASEDLHLSSFQGRITVLHAFQMLCPGCVAHGVPQAQRISATFSSKDVAVVGLHTVFEHHEAMRPISLSAFIHEYRISFPVGVDLPNENNPIPQTMKRYQMRGTPSLILIDRQSRIRLHTFGRPEDMSVGAAIASLLGESSKSTSDRSSESESTPSQENCSPEGCSI